MNILKYSKLKINKNWTIFSYVIITKKINHTNKIKLHIFVFFLRNSYYISYYKTHIYSI